MSVARMVQEILVANCLEKRFQTQPTKFSNENATKMEPALIEHSSSRTWAIAWGICRRIKFHCITNTFGDIGVRKPSELKGLI